MPPEKLFPWNTARAVILIGFMACLIILVLDGPSLFLAFSSLIIGSAGLFLNKIERDTKKSRR